jgi:hypothetical protein
MVGEGAQSESKKEKAVRPGTPKVEEDNVEEQDDKKGDVGKSDVANEKDNVENSNFADKNVRKDTVKADVEDEEASSPPVCIPRHLYPLNTKLTAIFHRTTPPTLSRRTMSSKMSKLKKVQVYRYIPSYYLPL